MSCPEEHPMADYARSFSYREKNGHLPDDIYRPGPEDDPLDPDQQEIRSLVEEGYAHNNAKRRDERLRTENRVLRELLEENGIEVPDEF